MMGARQPPGNSSEGCTVSCGSSTVRISKGKLAEPCGSSTARGKQKNKTRNTPEEAKRNNKTGEDMSQKKRKNTRCENRNRQDTKGTELGPNTTRTHTKKKRKTRTIKRPKEAKRNNRK